MKLYLSITLLLLSLTSCKRSYKEYFSDGKIKITGTLKSGLKEGWWTLHDSSTSKIIEERYYHKNEIYTLTKQDINGKCNYAEIRPLIEDDRDTMYFHTTDSVPINFIQKSKNVNITNYLLRVISSNSKVDGDVHYIIFPYQTKFIYFNEPGIYKKERLYYIDVEAMQSGNEKLCCCDSIEYKLTSKYVYLTK